MRFPHALLIFLAAASPETAFAQVAAADSGDTAWMILCALLLLLAAGPALMLRYAGQANVRSALSMVAQIMVAACGVALAWAVAGYSLAFAPGNAWLGGGANLMLANLGALREGMTVPDAAFALFQLGFALLSVCLIVGAVGGRTAIGWWAAFAPLWSLLVYAPIAHALWGGGWLAGLGVMDYAGGLVIHTTAGFSALALTLIVGPRKQAGGGGHAPLFSIVGGAILWIGLSGAAGGWALGAIDVAAIAILNHVLAGCAGALAWALIDRIGGGSSSATGFASGAVAGVAAVAASAGLIGAGGAILIGVAGATIGRSGAAIVRRRVDDVGEIFVIHGLGGAVGALALALFILPKFGGVGLEGDPSFLSMLGTQALGVVVVALWALVGSAIAALMVSLAIPMRVSAQTEAEGLDAAEHGEQSWDFR